MRGRQEGYAVVLAADWSKAAGKREVYRAGVGERKVTRVAPPREGWTVARVIAAARDAARAGRVLVGFDAPLGIPTAYWHAAQAAHPPWRACRGFVDWMPKALETAGFLEPATRLAECGVMRPFYAPPSGRWSRREWEAAFGLPTLRAVERGSGAKPVFLLRGLPGLAGPAAIDLWRGLADATARSREFDVWPFEDRGHPIVVAEMYPRALYAAALDSDSNVRGLAKTHEDARRAALARLRRAPWVRDGGVRLGGLLAAGRSEDAFDALLAAAGLLRHLLEGRAVASTGAGDPVAEGGILGITA